MIMGQNGLIFLGLAVVVFVIANAVAVQRRKARKEQTESFASLQGFRNEGDANPFLGVDVKRPVMEGGARLGGLKVGRAPIVPQMLIDLAVGRGTVRNVLRGPTVAGEVILFDYRSPVAGSNSESGQIFSTLAAFRVPGIPEFQLAPRARFTFAMELIDFPANARFSKRFMLMANDEPAVRRVFAPAVLLACEALMEKRDWYLQAGSGSLLVTFGRMRPEELPDLVEQSARVAAAMQKTTA